MEDVALGVLALLIGGLLCFRGYLALRLVISAWGALAGFLLGTGLVAGFTGERLLASVLGWTVGLGLAVIFGLLAYLYYAVSVVIGMGAIGFTLGTTVMVALGVSWSWLIVLFGISVGVVLALAAIVADLPMVLLALLSALAGASAMVTGLLLITGGLSVGDLTTGSTTATLGVAGWWSVAYALLVVAGTMVQLVSARERARTLRDAWAA